MSNNSLFFPQRERQAQREDAMELTEKLDQDWKEIQTLLSRKTAKSENKEKKEKPKVGVKLSHCQLSMQERPRLSGSSGFLPVRRVFSFTDK
jgi:hypothetical protein